MPSRPVSVPIHTWMVAYDVSDSRRRGKIAKALSGYGERVQFSVFECRLDTGELVRLRQDVLAIADLSSDRIRWYPLCRDCHGEIVYQGEGKIPEDEGFYLA